MQFLHYGTNIDFLILYYELHPFFHNLRCVALNTILLLVQNYKPSCTLWLLVWCIILHILHYIWQYIGTIYHTIYQQGTHDFSKQRKWIFFFSEYSLNMQQVNIQAYKALTKQRLYCCADWRVTQQWDQGISDDFRPAGMAVLVVFT